MGRRTIFHVDVNSAFLSWSAVYALQHGATVDLRNIPAVVGGSQATRHGIVLAKSIPAKAYSITTGEPIVQAKQKCPKLVIVPPNYWLYVQCSNAMMEIVRKYSDRVQVFSIDECFLDYTGMETIHGPAIEAANRLKDEIKEKLGFTCSIGISTNKLLAKMASELRKPDSVNTLFPEEIEEKMWPLPIEDLYMCGKATVPKLQKIGIFTIGDLARFDPEHLRHSLKSWGDMLWRYANGIENSEVRSEGTSADCIKGIGNSSTIRFDVEDNETAHKVLLSLTETVAMRLRHAGFCCRVVSVSIRTNKLFSYSHQRKLIVPTDNTERIYKSACKLFDESWKGEPIRSLGVRVSDLCSNDFIQLSLLEEYNEKKRKIDRAIDEIRMRYGARSVFRSTFLYSGLSPVTGGIPDEESNFVLSSIL